jgi:hypothetical protein
MAPPQVCHLEAAAGHDVECPGNLCPLWTDSACVIAGLRVDLGSNPDLVRLLGRIRDELGGIHVMPGNALLPPGLRA